MSFGLMDILHLNLTNRFATTQRNVVDGRRLLDARQSLEPRQQGAEEFVCVDNGATLRYRASKYDCQACRLKPRCCPKEPARYVPRSIYEGARDMARQIGSSWQGRTARRLRKKVEMLFAHLKRILRLDRLRLRGPNGARDEFLLAATAQNLRKLAKLIPMPSPHPA